MPRLVSTVSAIALLALLPAPLAAQVDGLDILGRLNKAGAEIEAALDAAEAHRLAGKCYLRQAELLRAKKIIEELEGIQNVGGGLGGTRERTNEARARAQAILNAPCPPVAETPPAPAVAAAPPAPAPAPLAREDLRTMTLEDLRVAFAAACGDGFEAARQRLLAGLTRAINFEKNVAKRDALRAERRRIIALPKVPCATPATPPQVGALPSTGASGAPVGTGVDDFGKAVAGRMGLATEIEQSFDVAERARLTGNCTLWGNRLSGIEMLIGAFESGDNADDAAKAAYADWRRRLAEARARPCPPTEWDEPPKVGALPSTGSPLGAASALAKARFAQRAGVLLHAYYLASLLPRTGIGVARAGAPGAAPENFAGQTPRRVNGFGISAGFQTKIAPDFDLRATGTYERGDARTDFTTPVSTPTSRFDTGIVYGRLSNGSSGIIAGFGGTGSARVDLEEWGIGGEVGWQIGEPSYLPYAVGLRAFVGADYKRSERRHDLSIASSGVSSGFTFNFSQTRLQKLEEDYVGFTGGIEAALPICEDMDLDLRLSGGPYRVATRLSSTERNTANFGPMGNQNLTIAIDQRDETWGGRLKAEAGLEYRVSETFALTANARYEYRSDVGSVVNPNSGDQVFFGGQTTRIGRDAWEAWSVGLGGRLRF